MVIYTHSTHLESRAGQTNTVVPRLQAWVACWSNVAFSTVNRQVRRKLAVQGAVFSLSAVHGPLIRDCTAQMATPHLLKTRMF